MAGPPKEKLEAALVHPETEEHGEQREVYLRDGRKLVVTEQGADQLVEVRAESGMLELRIRLTEQGPVLQMESVKLQLKASEAVEIASQKVSITGSEAVAVSGGKIEVEAETDLELESNGDVKVVGKMIYLN